MKKRQEISSIFFGFEQEGLKIDTEKIVKEVIFGLKYGIGEPEGFKESELQKFKKTFPYAKFYNAVLDRGWIAYRPVSK